MNAEELISLNNEKREYLHAENHAFYEEMLVYVRVNFNKSEQQTEEILMELLDHVLQAQEEGRSAQDVFGDDPKGYQTKLFSQPSFFDNPPRYLFPTKIPPIIYFSLRFVSNNECMLKKHFKINCLE